MARPKKVTTRKTTTKTTPTKKKPAAKKAPTKKKPVATAKKKAVKKPVPTAKKKAVKKPVPTVKGGIIKKTVKKKGKVLEYEYVRVSENARDNKFSDMGQRVQKGELQWAYYAIDGNVGYHYYRKLK